MDGGCQPRADAASKYDKGITDREAASDRLTLSNIEDSVIVRILIEGTAGADKSHGR